jgi:cupin superfamily acireductone dioxygenase involved in methionine salvage
VTAVNEKTKGMSHLQNAGQNQNIKKIVKKPGYVNVDQIQVAQHPEKQKAFVSRK